MKEFPSNLLSVRTVNSLMSNLTRILSLILVGSALVAPAGLYGLNSPRAQGPSSFEVTVSPTADLDPRNETSIAVSAKNDQVIVGASKVIPGGGTAGRGDNLVAYYFRQMKAGRGGAVC